MIKTHLLPISILFALLFFFVKIYQNNKIIKATYEQQRIEHAQTNLEKKQSALLIRLHELQNKTNIKQTAMNELGMQPLKLSHVRSFTSSEN